MTVGQTFPHANEEADRINKQGGVKAEVVRILPEDIDPIKDGDTGWCVEVTVLDNNPAFDYPEDHWKQPY